MKLLKLHSSSSNPEFIQLYNIIMYYMYYEIVNGLPIEDGTSNITDIDILKLLFKILYNSCDHLFNHDAVFQRKIHKANLLKELFVIEIKDSENKYILNPKLTFSSFYLHLFVVVLKF